MKILRRMTEQVKKAKSKEDLLLLWKNHIEPQNTKVWWGLLAGGLCLCI